MPDTKSLIGEKVYLRPIEPADLPHVCRWLNDPETRRLIGAIKPKSHADAEEWLDNIYKDPNRIWFVVVLRENDRVIGEAGLLRISRPWRLTDATMIIGEKDAVGKGCGTEAMHLLLDYAFNTLNLHRVALGVFDFNERALRFYEKCGFRREGALRDGYFCDGAFHNVVLMSILDTEFEKD